MKAGYAEIYKYGLLWDMDFANWLHEKGGDVLRHDVDIVHNAVKRCCEIKAEIVAQDEKEASVRALLNLGHTFGHALEALCNYDDRLKHGEAVSIGMVLAADLSQKMGLIDNSDVDVIESHLKSLAIPTSKADIPNCPKFGTEDMMNLMGRDKKAAADGLTFIVLNKLGEAARNNKVDEKLLRDVLDRFVSAA